MKKVDVESDVTSHNLHCVISCRFVIFALNPLGAESMQRLVGTIQARSASEWIPR